MHEAQALTRLRATRPWQVIDMDIIGALGGGSSNAMLVIMDRYTKFVLAWPLPSTSAYEVGRALIDMFGQHGKPQRICSDDSSACHNPELADLFNRLHIEHVIAKIA
jgi:hypothetical protein